MLKHRQGMAGVDRCRQASPGAYQDSEGDGGRCEGSAGVRMRCGHLAGVRGAVATIGLSTINAACSFNFIYFFLFMLLLFK